MKIEKELQVKAYVMFVCAMLGNVKVMDDQPRTDAVTAALIERVHAVAAEFVRKMKFTEK